MLRREKRPQAEGARLAVGKREAALEIAAVIAAFVAALRRVLTGIKREPFGCARRDRLRRGVVETDLHCRRTVVLDHDGDSRVRHACETGAGESEKPYCCQCTSCYSCHSGPRPSFELHHG